MRLEVGKSLGISTLTSQQVQMEILVEKREKISDCWVNKVRTICTKPKHCKNSLGISDQRSKCRNTLRGFQWSLLWILNVLIIRKFMTAGWLIVFFEPDRARELRIL